jgi:hypothetical protein
MSQLVDSTTRGPIDYFHFAVVFAGVILLAAGVVTVAAGMAAIGFLLEVYGMAYFLIRSQRRREGHRAPAGGRPETR